MISSITNQSYVPDSKVIVLKGEGREAAFCREFGTSASTLEMITGMRSQLLGQLRASGFVRPKGTVHHIGIWRNFLMCMVSSVS